MKTFQISFESIDNPERNSLSCFCQISLFFDNENEPCYTETIKLYEKIKLKFAESFSIIRFCFQNPREENMIGCVSMPVQLFLEPNFTSSLAQW